MVHTNLITITYLITDHGLDHDLDRLLDRDYLVDRDSLLDRLIANVTFRIIP